MARPTFLLLLFSTLCIPGCTPTALNPREESPLVYRAALEQIIDRYLFVRCVQEPHPGFYDKVIDDYRDGKTDSSRNAQVWDSLFTIRKTQQPKCVMEFQPLFSVFGNESFDQQCSMVYALHDDFFYQYFKNTRVYAVVDSLTKNTAYDWKDISPSYMEFVKHDSTDHQHPFGKNENGIIALSKIYFNQAADHALLFFEIVGDHKHQRGELALLEKTGGHWKVVGFRTIWIT